MEADMGVVMDAREIVVKDLTEMHVVMGVLEDLLSPEMIDLIGIEAADKISEALQKVTNQAHALRAGAERAGLIDAI